MIKISLGYCGATDCCLCLSFRGESKQYGIGSGSIDRIEEIWWMDMESYSNDPIFIEEESPEGQVLQGVWRDGDDDIFEGGEE